MVDRPHSWGGPQRISVLGLLTLDGVCALASFFFLIPAIKHYACPCSLSYLLLLLLLLLLVAVLKFFLLVCTGIEVSRARMKTFSKIA